MKFYSELSDKNKEILFKIIEQVEVDAVSNILGVYEEEISSDKEVSTKYLMNRLNRFKEIKLLDGFMYGDD